LDKHQRTVFNRVLRGFDTHDAEGSGKNGKESAQLACFVGSNFCTAVSGTKIGSRSDTTRCHCVECSSTFVDSNNDHFIQLRQNEVHPHSVCNKCSSAHGLIHALVSGDILLRPESPLAMGFRGAPPPVLTDPLQPRIFVVEEDEQQPKTSPKQKRRRTDDDADEDDKPRKKNGKGNKKGGKRGRQT